MKLCLSSAIFVFAASNVCAATYTWTGLAGNGLWSNPANWASGLVPVSATDSIIDFSSGGPIPNELTQDISVNFDIGTIIGVPSEIPGNILLSGGNVKIHQAVTDMDLHSLPNGPSISLGNAALTHTLVEPDYHGESPRNGSALGNVALDGSITVNGGWVLDFAGGTGAIHLNTDASIDARGAIDLNAFDGQGWFGMQGAVTMVGDQPADLSQGTLDLGRNDQTLSANYVGHLTVDGDVKLGAMKLQGEPTGQQYIDRLDVTGTLDLTNASLSADSAGYFDTSYNTDHYVIATYGNRIGEFAPGTVTFLATQDFQTILGFFEAEVVYTYTSAEGAGPGEVWLMVPEPSTALMLAMLIPLTLRGRR